MADRDDDSLIDKVKNALGMGDRGADARREPGVPAGTRTDDPQGTADRPAGPDYAARDPESELGRDFDDPRDARARGLEHEEPTTTRESAATSRSGLTGEEAPEGPYDADRRNEGL